MTQPLNIKLQYLIKFILSQRKKGMAQNTQTFIKKIKKK